MQFSINWQVAGFLAGMTALLAGCGGGDDTGGSVSRAAEEEPVQVALTAADLAGPKAYTLFSAKATPSPDRPHAIGAYARGCGAGMVSLPETGPTWQAMRLSRNRFWGQPDLVDFIEDLSNVAAHQPGWAGLYVGDLSQPRGGPMLSSHASHQVGLDVDFWMLPPKRLDLSRSEREKVSTISIQSADQRGLNGNWTPGHAAILEAAARDPRVDRIFVAAPAKIAMCATAKPSDKEWMQKLRPLWNHHDHFHVRLKCPAGDASCIAQTPTVAALSNGGNGCDDSLMWWVTDALKPAKPSTGPAAPRKRGAKDFVLAELPGECRSVLAAQ